MVWIICGLLWCFYQLFGLSFWWHPFTAEDPLVSKWWNATFIWWRNKLIYILDDLTVSTFSTNVYRRVNYSFQSEFKRKTSISLLKCKLIFAVNLKYLHLHLADALIQSDPRCMLYISSVHAFPGNWISDPSVASVSNT